jgi:TetR/AcrR family transcriptional repressor of nem operon
MRRSKKEAAETRRRIVESAANEFRRKGIAGAGLSDLMAAAGLTHGGFYRHFESKDELVSEAIKAAVESMFGDLASAVSREEDGGGLRELMAMYLSINHRDDPLSGCPLAYLGTEIARADNASREAATDGFLRLVHLLAAQTGKPNSRAAKRKAMVAASTMIGALMMSRVVTDPEISKTLLDETAMQLVGSNRRRRLRTTVLESDRRKAQ